MSCQAVDLGLEGVDSTYRTQEGQLVLEIRGGFESLEKDLICHQ